MKQILFFAIATAVVTVSTIAYKVYNVQQMPTMTEFELRNAEALATGEGGGRGCTIDRNAICETSHADYIEYRNN